MKTPCSLLLLPLLCLLDVALPGQLPTTIVAGIGQVSPLGLPGAITTSANSPAFPLVGGDDDTSLPSAFAVVARNVDANGWAVAVGHDGMLKDAANAAFDTLQFNLQAMTWLDRNQTHRIAVLSGHGEFANVGNMGTLIGALTAAGWTVTDLPGPVTTAALAGVGVVVIGNAWNPFTPAELAALRTHAIYNGSIYMAGLGWSFAENRPGEQYPMNVLGAKYGLSFLRQKITDPTDNLNGAAVFHSFYPNIGIQGSGQAANRLDTILTQHPTDLVTFLRGDAAARRELLSCGVHATIGATSLATDSSNARQYLDHLLRNLMLQHPQWLALPQSYDRALDGELIVVRAALAAAVTAAFDLDATRLPLVEAALGIDGPQAGAEYRTILREHGFVVLDNGTFGATHFAIINDLMSTIPTVPRDLRRMTCREEWSTDATLRDTQIVGDGVNVFGPGWLGMMQNQFPSDSTPTIVPIFATTVCHEVAHVIDSYRMRTSPTYAARRLQLLTAAGLDELQYLRSQFGGAFFQNAPLEFVASLANEWNIDSVKTLRLAVQRFAAGKSQPIAQALLMADTYAHDGSTTPLYTMAATGRISTTTANLMRDVLGRITDICNGAVHFRVSYDAQGNVTNAVELTTPSCTPAWQDLGLGLAGTYGVPVAVGGGSFAAGQVSATHLRHAYRNSVSLVALGFQRVDLPLFGGTLVPSPDVIVVLPVDANGEASLTLALPANYATGSQVWFQHWILDPAAPELFAVSNGLVGTTP